MRKKVAIQGIKGAFHDEAAKVVFGEDIEIVPAHSFEEEIEMLQSGACDFAMMAIENTISGTILSNYELILKSDVRIVGETKLRIKQNLGVVPGTELSQLKEVRSHYMALNQCRGFLGNHPRIKLIESIDTAKSIEDVAIKNDRSIGAIGSKLAIEEYGLELLAESIETDDRNYTRFAVLALKDELNLGQKVSMAIVLKHETGALSRAISLLNLLDTNLTKIESTPVVGSPFQYRFYLDFILEGSLGFEVILDALRPLTIELKILGKYKAMPLSIEQKSS